MDVSLTVSRICKGRCPLVKREAEGIVVTFGDGSFTKVFVSFKGFEQLMRLKFPEAEGQLTPSVGARATAVNGQA